MLDLLQKQIFFLSLTNVLKYTIRKYEGVKINIKIFEIFPNLHPLP